jgi:hypothetical protein
VEELDGAVEIAGQIVAGICLAEEHSSDGSGSECVVVVVA